MKKRERRQQAVESRWLARFGEPPSLRTDPGLMEEILDKAGPAPRGRAGRHGPSHGEESVV